MERECMTALRNTNNGLFLLFFTPAASRIIDSSKGFCMSSTEIFACNYTNSTFFKRVVTDIRIIWYIHLFMSCNPIKAVWLYKWLVSIDQENHLHHLFRKYPFLINAGVRRISNYIIHISPIKIKETSWSWIAWEKRVRGYKTWKVIHEKHFLHF